MKKKILAVLLCVAMMLSIAPIAVFADGTGQGGAGFQPGPAIFGNNLAKIGETEYATFAAAVTAAADGDTIILLDTVTLSTETGNDARWGFPISKNITIDLNGKSFAQGGLDVYADVTIKDSVGGGNIYGTYQAVYANPNSSLTIEGGSFSSGNKDSATIIVDSAELTMTGGAVYNNIHQAAISVTGTGSAEISGGTITGHDWGVTAFDTASVKVTGTASINATNGYGISTNGNAGEGATVQVWGGTVSGSELGIYAPSGTLNVSGGTITGATGIYFKSTSLNITGGTIIGTGADVDYNYNGNGANPTGDALVIDSCGYPNGINGVSVTGGTFTSANADAVAAYTYQENTPVEKFISGGTFNSDPTDYLADGFIPETSIDPETGDTVYGVDGPYAVVIGTTGYATFEEAYQAAADRDTITLCDDISVNTGASASSRYAIAKSITIDGGNHTITINNRGFGVGMNASAPVDVTFENVTINNTSNGGRCIDTRGNLNSLTLDHVTLSTAGNSGYLQPLTIGGNQ
ncbi:MAG: hypothetical protein IJQ80_06105, partial [Clostridia bacterium]|nr:hypothetical protein [Clostridia bacterium]